MPLDGPGPFFMQQPLATPSQDGLLTKEGYSAIVAAGATVAVSTKTATYTASARELVPVNPTGGAFALHLPTAVGLTVDDAVIVVNVSASTNAVTVDANGGAQTISGAASYAASTSRGVYAFVPLAGNWIANPPPA